MIRAIVLSGILVLAVGCGKKGQEISACSNGFVTDYNEVVRRVRIVTAPLAGDTLSMIDAFKREYPRVVCRGNVESLDSTTAKPTTVDSDTKMNEFTQLIYDLFAI